MNPGYEHAQALYDRQLPPESKTLYGFQIGDEVEIIDPFLRDMPEVDGYENVGVIEYIFGDQLKVRCGMRYIFCFADDLKRCD